MESKRRRESDRVSRVDYYSGDVLNREMKKKKSFSFGHISETSNMKEGQKSFKNFFLEIQENLSFFWPRIENI